MATPLAVLSNQKIALVGTFLGVSLVLAQNILTNHDLYTFRKNKSVFGALVIGTIACVLFSLFAVHLMVNPLDPWVLTKGQQPMQWIWTTYSVALYHILIERTIAISRVNIRKSEVENVLRYFVPFIMAMPQLICVGIIHLPITWVTDPVLLQTFRNATVAGASISVISNAILSLFFIRILATHRSKGMIDYVMENKKESAGLVIRMLIATGYVIIKLVSIAIPTASQPQLFSLFHNAFAGIVTLNTFGDYIIITKKVGKAVLASGFEVKTDNKKSSANKTVNSSSA
ncbi:hypothetical protein BKA69DRAFT_1107787 [Paraphysoderma sedebokerense]|nr:hypothetical protein BKA69DRAFT_1107787 [Paraphysoderma sedebokerense]